MTGLRPHPKTLLAGLLLVAVVAISLGAGTAAAVEEVENSTVEVTNQTDSIYADVGFNETAGTDTVTATVRLLDQNGSEVTSATIDGVDNDSVMHEFDVEANNLETSTDFRVVVEVNDGNSGYVTSTEVGTFEQVAGGGAANDPMPLGLGAPIAALAATAGIGYLRSRD